MKQKIILPNSHLLAALEAYKAKLKPSEIQMLRPRQALGKETLIKLYIRKKEIEIYC